jgi:hypothetical protein
VILCKLGFARLEGLRDEVLDELTTNYTKRSITILRTRLSLTRVKKSLSCHIYRLIYINAEGAYIASNRWAGIWDARGCIELQCGTERSVAPLDKEIQLIVGASNAWVDKSYHRKLDMCFCASLAAVSHPTNDKFLSRYFTTFQH